MYPTFFCQCVAKILSAMRLVFVLLVYGLEEPSRFKTCHFPHARRWCYLIRSLAWTNLVDCYHCHYYVTENSLPPEYAVITPSDYFPLVATTGGRLMRVVISVYKKKPPLKYGDDVPPPSNSIKRLRPREHNWFSWKFEHFQLVIFYRCLPATQLLLSTSREESL